ncbi:GFA family protein [Sphingomicrobium sediminis]|uniref:CENP-V/GFA domain-containing protein n=1 Tax=Sphingomicrobium sediminis TaxID=2950949 RepID=A0A9X2EMX4_9SPHN|nr:hypothetical protein [Sphingomicrobium sediminis]MCM8558152.1 hypothetical protein [Sphingomicrobium sediminis]
MAHWEGSCHCGSVTMRYDSDLPLTLRACQCSFCRKHGSTNASDPDGQLAIRSDLTLLRYRFGLGITDFLICPNCGVYVAAVMEGEKGLIGTANMNCFDVGSVEVSPIDYAGENAGDRTSRREDHWTPTTLVEA